MKDFKALSRKHFDRQAAKYGQRDTYYYSQNGKISCRDIAQQIKGIPYVGYPCEHLAEYCGWLSALAQGGQPL